MIDEIIEKIKDKKKIVFLPSGYVDYLESLNYMFDNSVIVIEEYLIQDYSKLINIINNSKLKEIYLVNFLNLYRKVVPEIHKKIIINEILTSDVANLTSGFVLPTFFDVTEFYERKNINKIYASNESMYQILKKAKYNVEKINFNLPFNKKELKKENKNSKSIGILSHDYDPVHNFYNMLTAISLVNDYDKVKFISNMNSTVNFFNHFDIEHEFCENIDDVMKDNFVNLYCNFTNTNPCVILKSMDIGIPCIVGNTDIFDNNKYLKEYLVLKSDDDVNEIANKINNVKNNYDKIIDEYKKWRNNYEKRKN